MHDNIQHMITYTAMTVDCIAQLCEIILLISVTPRLRFILLFSRFQVPLQICSQAMAAYSCYMCPFHVVISQAVISWYSPSHMYIYRSIKYYMCFRTAKCSLYIYELRVHQYHDIYVPQLYQLLLNWEVRLPNTIFEWISNIYLYVHIKEKSREMW